MSDLHSQVGNSQNHTPVLAERIVSSELQSTITTYQHQTLKHKQVLKSGEKVEITGGTGGSNINVSLSPSEVAQPKVVLYWTKWHAGDWPMKTGMIRTDQGNECVVTYNRTEYTNSHAVVLHGRDRGIYLDNPHVGARSTWPVWVYNNMEAPMHTNAAKSLNGLFNWTETFHRDSDVPLPYGYMAPGVHNGGYNTSRNYMEGKKKMAAVMVSNCFAPRMKYIEALQQHISLDVYGKCGNMSFRFPRYRHPAEWLKQYRFYLSFENCICRDYVTEKFYRNALSSGVVPVVISGANFSNPSVAPANGFINALDFTKVENLADHLKRIASNVTLYNQYFRWHSNWTVHIHSPTSSPENICDALYRNPPLIKVHNDLATWYSRTKNCGAYPEPI